MMKIAFLLTLVVAVLVCLQPAAPAQAASASRTFLSAAGSDSNNCINVATPCRHLATAYAATLPNGEIYVLDPANYGSLTITGPVSIEGHGWASIAPPSGTNTAAITINANASDKINIIGVVLDGTAIATTTGIQFNSGGTLTVRDSVIRNFFLSGIAFEPNTSSLTQLVVSNTFISDNGGSGIGVVPTGSGTVGGAISHVEMTNNSGSGLIVQTSTATIKFTVRDSESAENSDGIDANSNGATPVSIMVRNSMIANNGISGLQASGTGAIIRVTRSSITGNASGWIAPMSGIVSSYGDNNIDGNTNINTEPPSPLTYK
jgi:hypothetical protein